MFVRSFAIKGAVGVAACASVAVPGIIYRKQIKERLFSSSEETPVGKVGLRCENPGEQGVVCTKKKDNIKIKRGESSSIFTISDISSNGSKIKLYKVSGSDYSHNFKFVVEGGDIGSGDNKLEELETYEIKEENGEYHLERKDTSDKTIKALLGLPSDCNLPSDASNPTTCDDLDLGKIKTIAFEDGGNGEPTLTGTVKLTISKENGNDSGFPFGYKFSFQGKDADATLTWANESKSISFKNGQNTEYKIKRNEGKLTLEKAWTLDKLTEKVGLSCSGSPTATSGVECTKKAGSSTIKVKQGDSTTFDLSTISTGKIKVYTDDVHSHGFKFSIEDGDISGTSSNKLEQFETYEIKEESGTWYLKRKAKAAEKIKVELGLPSNCSLPENTNGGGSNCSSISSEALKSIKFEGKKEGGATIESNGNTTLTISKVSDSLLSDYPLGYKFTFQPDQKMTIKDSPEESIAANIGIDYKIKKEGNSLSLEKAWTLETLANKVGLESCTDNSGTTTCSIKNNSFNVKHEEGSGEENKTKSSSSTGTEGKIKVHKDIAGHKEGFKFVIEEGDIALSNGGGTISKLEEFETYEIEESGDKYYLSRKSKAFKEISKSLSLPSGCDQLDNNQTECTNLTKDKIKGINFEGKSGADITVDTSGSTIKLKVTKLTSTDATFPHGYKFTLESNKDITIPKSSGGNISIKKDTNTEFKLKKTGSGNNISLSLEKAWTPAELGKKVGLSCTESDKSCTLTDGSINVHNGNDSSKFKNLSKNDSSDTKKVKYEEDKEGYNQGFRFYVDGEEDITLKNGGGEGSSDSKKIEKKNGSGGSGNEVYYEIKKDADGSWYLFKKANTPS